MGVLSYFVRRNDFGPRHVCVCVYIYIYIYTHIHTHAYIRAHTYMYLVYLVALGLHCYTRAFSSCGKCGLFSVAVRELLIVVASLVA